MNKERTTMNILYDFSNNVLREVIRKLIDGQKEKEEEEWRDYITMKGMMWVMEDAISKELNKNM